MSSRQSQASSTGTGYGGDDRYDKQQRKALRQQAQSKENQLFQVQETLLISATGTLACREPEQEIIKTLKEVLRNQADWASRKKLYQGALDCCRLITKHYPRVLGKEDDDESILSALQEFASTAEIITKHQKDSQKADIALAQKTLTIRDEAMKASKAAIVRPELSVLDHHDHYRQILRPFSFAFVENLEGHFFAKSTSSSTSPAQRKKLLRELTTYKTALPVEYGSSIFVRAMEGRMDLLRAMILAPSESPYACGCFVFDISLSGYPNKAPKVQFLTTGGGKYRFNPNLYNCGKVCLSLLGTWSGPGWVSNESTLLQILVSIQSLILVEDPYFNEPGYQASQGTPNGTRESDKYNLSIRRYTMDAAILPYIRDGGEDAYPEFQEVVSKHFALKKHALQQQLARWYKEDSSTVTTTSSRYRPQDQQKGPNMESLYNQCLQVWESDLDRKRKAKASSKNATPFVPYVGATFRESGGIVEIDDFGCVVATQDMGGVNEIANLNRKRKAKSSCNNAAPIVPYVGATFRESGGIIEIDDFGCVVATKDADGVIEIDDDVRTHKKQNTSAKPPAAAALAKEDEYGVIEILGDTEDGKPPALDQAMGSRLLTSGSQQNQPDEVVDLT
jgi:ubiquitin-protein ligase